MKKQLSLLVLFLLSLPSLAQLTISFGGGSSGGSSTTVVSTTTKFSTRRVSGNTKFTSHYGALSPTTETVRTDKYIFRPAFDMINAQFEWTNQRILDLGLGTPGDVAGPNDVTITKAYLSNGTTQKQITFERSNSVTLTPGAKLWNDPFPIPLYANADCELRVVRTVTSGNQCPTGTITAGSILGDAGATGTITTTAVTGFGPVDLVGVPLSKVTKKSICVLSASLEMGGGGVVELGYAIRAFNANGSAWKRVGAGSMRLAHFIQTGSGLGLAQALDNECDVFYIGIGGTDALNAPSVQAYLDLLQQFINYGVAAGKEVWISTLPSNGLIAGDATKVAQRAQINDAIRAGLPGVTRVVNLAFVTETGAVNSNTQRANIFVAFPDLTHFSAAGEVIVAAEAFPSSWFVKDN
ncbi:hypothetical protein [Spirosoma areae]